MFKSQLDALDSFAEKINHSASFRRRALFFIFLSLGVALAITGLSRGISKFSPDSWAYYELSQTVFTDAFYRFNTHRSYYSSIYSTSFPFGYPVLLAAAQYFFGYAPFTAVIINLSAALLTWILLIRLAAKLEFSSLSGLALATSLILFTPYLDEVFAGRSIPVAILLFMSGIAAFFSDRFFACGIFIGLSALVRFDHLLYALIFQASVFILHYKNRKKILTIFAGFFIGILPWVLYSYFYFGRLLVSDNSWVALSAVPAFVVDYPASARITAYDNPILWIERVLSNIIPLLHSIVKSSFRLPLLLALLYIFIISFRATGEKNIRKLFFAGLALLAISLAPFLLTGYFDKRYFALTFLLLGALLVFYLEALPLQPWRQKIFCRLVGLSIFLSLLMGSVYMAQAGWGWFKKYGNPDPDEKILMALEKCHSHQPDMTFIFTVNSRLAARYGATTGNAAAFLPTNFARLSHAEKSAYFSQMHPFLLIDDSFTYNSCPIQK